MLVLFIIFQIIIIYNFLKIFLIFFLLEIWVHPPMFWLFIVWSLLTEESNLKVGHSCHWHHSICSVRSVLMIWSQDFYSVIFCVCINKYIRRISNLESRYLVKHSEWHHQQQEWPFQTTSLIWQNLNSE